MTTTPPVPEFSVRVIVAELDGEPRDYSIAADESERKALAKRFDLLALDRLEADVTVSPRRGSDIVGVTGRFEADVVQACVVTLEPVPATVTGDFDRTFASPHLCALDHVVEIDPDREDPPDPITDGSIDIGEVVAEHMGLELEPFPRAPGAEFESTQNGGEGAAGATDTKPNPFAILEKLKDR